MRHIQGCMKFVSLPFLDLLASNKDAWLLVRCDWLISWSDWQWHLTYLHWFSSILSLCTNDLETRQLTCSKLNLMATCNWKPFWILSLTVFDHFLCPCRIWDKTTNSAFCICTYDYKFETVFFVSCACKVSSFSSKWQIQLFLQVSLSVNRDKMFSARKSYISTCQNEPRFCQPKSCYN